MQARGTKPGSIRSLLARTPLLLCMFGCLQATIFLPDATADDFKGKGNRADWSEALPYYNRGNKYLSAQRYEEAIRDLEDAVAIYPFDPDFFINLGVAYRKVDNYGAAEKAFKKAIELDDKDWTSWSNLANAYLKQNMYSQTKNAFEECLKRNPPASEKIAIEQDLKDLQKIINMQKAKEQTSPAAKNATAGKDGKPHMQQGASNSSVNRQSLKDSGWDWSY